MDGEQAAAGRRRRRPLARSDTQRKPAIRLELAGGYLANKARQALLWSANLQLLRAKDAYGSNWLYTALQRSWMLAERAFEQLASVRSKSVSFASPCCSMSFATL
jgi:hypothetical protein